jgi:hypothetical protein
VWVTAASREALLAGYALAAWDVAGALRAAGGPAQTASRRPGQLQEADVVARHVVPRRDLRHRWPPGSATATGALRMFARAAPPPPDLPCCVVDVCTDQVDVFHGRLTAAPSMSHP